MSKKYVLCFALIGSLSLTSFSAMAAISKEDYKTLRNNEEAAYLLIEKIENDFGQDEWKTVNSIGAGDYDKGESDLAVTLLMLDGTVVSASGHPQEYPPVNLSYLKDDKGTLYVQDILGLCRFDGYAQRFVKNTSIKGKITNARFYAKQTKDGKFVILVRKADSTTVAPEKGTHEALTQKK